MRDALDIKSTEWHEPYFRGRTQVFGYGAPIRTSAMTGVCASKQTSACTKRIMTAGWGYLVGEKINTYP